jgi:hypothetical protein
MQNAPRAKLLRDSPAEDSLDSPDSAVDDTAAQIVLDHGLLQGLECQRPEFGGPGMAVEPLEQGGCGLDIGDFPGRLTVFAVMLGGESPVASEDFNDRKIGVAELRARQVPASGQPFADQSIVLDPAGLYAVGPQVDVRAVERDDGLPAGLVPPIAWVGIGESRHVQPFEKDAQNGIYRFGFQETGRTADHRQVI